jgi:hypothetical protein
MKSRLKEITNRALPSDQVETHDLHWTPGRGQLAQGLVCQAGKFAGLAGHEKRVEKLLVELAGLGMEDFREFLAKHLGANPTVTGALSGRYRFQVTIDRWLKTDCGGVSSGLVGGQRAQELGRD